MLVTDRPIKMPGRSRYVHWVCDCDCGWSCVKSSQWLRRAGEQANCGCLNGWLPLHIQNLVGVTFGKLTVIEFSKTSGGIARWVCRCECGNEVVRKTVDLTTGLAQSCGCSKITSAKAVGRLYAVYQQVKTGAASRGLDFELSRDQVSRIVSSPCRYCGREPSPRNGVDRLDNSVGYTAENSVSCCRQCNRAKDVYSESEFLYWVKSIFENRSLDSYSEELVRSKQSIARDDVTWQRLNEKMANSDTSY